MTIKVRKVQMLINKHKLMRFIISKGGSMERSFLQSEKLVNKITAQSLHNSDHLNTFIFIILFYHDFYIFSIHCLEVKFWEIMLIVFRFLEMFNYLYFSLLLIAERGQGVGLFCIFASILSVHNQ